MAQSHIIENAIQDPKVKKRVTLCGGNVQLLSPGFCKGMTQWFIYLYLNTKNQFTNPRNHMLALSQEFIGGAGADPVLLQCIKLGKGKLLNLKIGTQSQHSHGFFSNDPVPILSHTIPNPKIGEQQQIFSANYPHQFVSALSQLPVGAYSIHMPKHLVAYIKIDDKLGFYFDPNLGVQEIYVAQGQGKHIYELLVNTITKTRGCDLDDFFLLKAMKGSGENALSVSDLLPKKVASTMYATLFAGLDVWVTPYTQRTGASSSTL